MLKFCYFLIQINFVVEAMSIILTVTDFYTIIIIFVESKVQQRVLLVLLFVLIFMVSSRIKNV